MKSTGDLGRAIAESYISKERPDELAYFGLIWERVSSMALGQGRTEGLASLAQRVRGLPFTREAIVELLSPFVVVAVLATLAEMGKTGKLPDSATLERGVSACAREFGLPSSRAASLAAFLGPALREQWDLLQRCAEAACRVLEIDEQVVVDACAAGSVSVRGTAHKISQEQSRSLWLHLLRNEKVHWVEGYIIFRRWRSRPPSHPPRQFENAVTRLNKELKQTGCGLAVRPVKEGHANTGYWQLAVPTTVELAGEVPEARREGAQALAEVTKGNYAAAAQTAMRAFGKDPASDEAAKALVESSEQMAGTEVPAEVLWNTRKELQQRVYGLERGIGAARGLKAPPHSGRPWDDVDDVIRQLEGQLSELRALYGRLDAKAASLPPPSKEYVEFEHIAEMVRQCKNSRDDAQRRAFDELARSESVRDILNRAVDTVKKVLRIRGPRGGRSFDSFLDDTGKELSQEEEQVVTSRDVCVETYSSFQQIVLGPSFVPEEYSDFRHLTSALRRQLTMRVVEVLIKEKLGVGSEQQRDVRDLRGASRKLSPQGEPPAAEAIPKRLKKWDTQRFEATTKAEALLSGSIDLQAYYRVFRATEKEGTE